MTSNTHIDLDTLEELAMAEIFRELSESLRVALRVREERVRLDEQARCGTEIGRLVAQARAEAREEGRADERAALLEARQCVDDAQVDARSLAQARAEGMEEATKIADAVVKWLHDHQSR